MADFKGACPTTSFRRAGVAIPVFSLRSQKSLGVGEFVDLKLLADWASMCGLKAIQILPVNDTTSDLNFTDSCPYSCISVFALHPIYIRLEEITAIPKDMSDQIKKQREILNHLDTLDYQKVMAFKWGILEQIYSLNRKQFLKDKGFQSFFDENSHWLKPYAAFCLLRDKYRTVDFTRWRKFSKPTVKDIENLTSTNSDDYDIVAKYYFVQYHLHRQLLEASEYAKAKGVILKGDIQIGINKCSDSCWSEPDLFHMGQSAGAPPDPFSDYGQNWGFPTYNWETMKKDDYSWWKRRLKQMSAYFNMIRLDHILGFFRIWEIPLDNISGIMGHFNPAIPVARKEFEDQGIWDFDRLTHPYIPRWLVDKLFGADAEAVIKKYLTESHPGFFALKPKFATQKQIEENLGDCDEKIKSGLFALVSNIILFKDAKADGFHFRVNMSRTSSFHTLDDWLKEKLKHFYIDYFYKRQDELWQNEAIERLSAVKNASSMLVCGEDLGFVPDCVPPTMMELGILGLKIQRMPKEQGREFGFTDQYPYLTVCSTSTHDTSTIRGWWQEDPEKIQHYYNDILRHDGPAPKECIPAIAEEIITQHFNSPSMWVIIPIQDLLAMDKGIRTPGNPKKERINDPSQSHLYWKYRLHINLEGLKKQMKFNGKILDMLTAAGRT